jgi:hypothetical protein
VFSSGADDDDCDGKCCCVTDVVSVVDVVGATGAGVSVVAFAFFGGRPRGRGVAPGAAAGYLRGRPGDFFF